VRITHTIPTAKLNFSAAVRAVILVVCFVFHIVAQSLPKPEEVADAAVEPPSAELRTGMATEVTLVVTIRKGFHINSHEPLEKYLIPSRVELAEPKHFELVEVKFPRGELKSFSFSPNQKLSVYDGSLRLPLYLRAKKGTARGKHTVGLTFHYQACNDQLCLRPASREATLFIALR